jgi:hypothetical protein
MEGRVKLERVGHNGLTRLTITDRDGFVSQDYLTPQEQVDLIEALTANLYGDNAEATDRDRKVAKAVVNEMLTQPDRVRVRPQSMDL